MLLSKKELDCEVEKPLFTHPEWKQDAQTRFRQAELERIAAERLTKDADRFEDETDKRTDRTLADVNKKLDQRADDIKYWEGELDKATDDIYKEIDKLGEMKKRIGKARDAAKDHLYSAQACWKNRMDRYGIDHCNDDVHKYLCQEMQVFQRVIDLLNKTEEQADEQLRRDRKVKYRLDKDMLRKKMALSIDEYALDSKPHSKDIYDLSEKGDPNNEMISEQDWTDMVNDNINNAKAELYNSENMRSLIDGILQQAANDMKYAVEDTNKAFKRRIDELVDTKGKLEEHLKHILQEIKDTETSLEDLRECLKKKLTYLQLAKHRLNQRNLRPGSELTADRPHFRLLEEICEIELDIMNLKQRIEDHEMELKALRRRQLSLEEDIQCKSNSIFIDQVICMGIREGVSIKYY